MGPYGENNLFGGNFLRALGCFDLNESRGKQDRTAKAGLYASVVKFRAPAL